MEKYYSTNTSASQDACHSRRILPVLTAQKIATGRRNSRTNNPRHQDTRLPHGSPPQAVETTERIIQAAARNAETAAQVNATAGTANGTTRGWDWPLPCAPCRQLKPDIRRMATVPELYYTGSITLFNHHITLAPKSRKFPRKSVRLL